MELQTRLNVLAAIASFAFLTAVVLGMFWRLDRGMVPVAGSRASSCQSFSDGGSGAKNNLALFHMSAG